MFLRCISSLICTLLWLIPVQGWAAVTWDNDTTSDSAGTDTTDSFSHTVGSGSNGYAGACVITRGGSSITVSSVSVGGSAGSQIAVADSTTTGGGIIRVEIWGRAIGSTSGAITIAPTVSAGDNFRTVAFSLFGVDQANPVGTANGVTGASTSLTATVSSAVGELVLGCLGVSTGTSNHAVGANETQQWLNTSDTNNTIDMGMTEPGAASVSIIPTWTTGHYSVLAAVPFKAAAAATPQSLMMLGVGN
jgi:hypothetical protein